MAGVDSLITLDDIAQRMAAQPADAQTTAITGRSRILPMLS
jgi:hypothetical protein